jgi:hypothetical protein
MTEKIVMGKFRANLAMIFSVLALAVSLVAFHEAGRQSGLKAEIKNLQKKLAEVKKETAKRLVKVRQETGQPLVKIGKAVKFEESE